LLGFRAHFLLDLARRHVVGLCLKAGHRTRDESEDVRARGELDANVNPAIVGDLVPAIEDCAGRKIPAP
jgi:hypothetical protein